MKALTCSRSSTHVDALPNATVLLCVLIVGAWADTAAPAVPVEAECIAAQGSVDATSLMQNANVRLDYLSSQELKSSPAPASHSSRSRASSPVKQNSEHLSAVGGTLQSRLGSFVKDHGDFVEASKRGLSGTRNTNLFFIVFVLMLLIFCCAVLMLGRLMTHRREVNEDQKFSAPPRATDMFANRQAVSLPASMAPPLSHPVFGSTASLGNRITIPAYTISAPQAGVSQLPEYPPTPPSPQIRDPLEHTRPKKLPPPICEAMVLPMCEVRFGVALEDITNLQLHDDLRIVGLSGNTLLRANVQKVANGHALSILMPEVNSTPRAIVRPSAQDPEMFEVVGFRGKDYGLLHTRRSSVCYVTHQSKIVLTVDGKFDDYHIWLKADVDDEQNLASMQPSCGTFAGGKEHLEIRVEPGVDSVLVLASVLSVLLLSPHHRVGRFF